jgi:hypothetical protein
MGLEFKTDNNGNNIPVVPEGSDDTKGLLHNSKNEIEVSGEGGSSVDLTTTGTSGAASYIDGVLNIPIYASTGGSPWVTLEDYGGQSDALGAAGFDSTTAWDNALDALETAGGGVLLLNAGAGERYNLSPDQSSSRDYSNITITSLNKSGIYLFKEPTRTLRGVLVRMADGTNNFNIGNIDILVSSEGLITALMTNGVICADIEASVNNIIIDGVKIYNEVKADNVFGLEGINFYRLTSNASDTKINSNITVRNCDIKLYGSNSYGIHTLRPIDNFNILNNKVELVANTNAAADAYNAIAVYGDCEGFLVDGNVVTGSGHSGIAISSARKGAVVNNRVSNVMFGQNINEAGIEVEFKAGHGSSTTPIEAHDVIVSNNYVERCKHGIMIAERAPTANTIAPYRVIVDSNIINDVSSSAILVGETTVATAQNGLIRNVHITNNIMSQPSNSGSGIRVAHAKDIKILNNTADNFDKAIHLGRNSTLKIQGNVDVIGNSILRNGSYGIYVETATDLRLRIVDNTIEGGIRGVLSSIAYGNPENSMVICKNNYVEGQSDDGYLMTALPAGSSISGNVAMNSLQRGFDCRIEDGIFTDNLAKGCSVTSRWDTDGSTVATNNKEI